MDYRALGKRVRQQRVMLDLTQEELAEKSGISCSFVGHIERGEKKFSIETLVSLCNALNIAPNALLQDSLEPNVLNDSVDVGEENRELFMGIVNVFREHNFGKPRY